MPDPDTTTRDLVPAAARSTQPNVTHTLYTFLIGEAATRPDACTPEVLLDQIEEVATIAKMLRLSIGRVPASVCPPGMVEPFTLYENNYGAIAVAVKHDRGIAFLTNEWSLKYYSKQATWLRSVVAENPWP